jgi:hypothetical protein
MYKVHLRTVRADRFMFQVPSLTLSAQDLHQCAQYARVRMARDGNEWLFMMPLYVLGHFFGDDWVHPHLFEGGFLKPPSKFEDRAKEQRIGSLAYALAEELYNLQGVEGFDGVHARILEGNIQSCVGELEAAGFLKRRSQQIRFVTPTGRIGNDYDLEIIRDAGAICCEVKIKIEAEQFTEAGVFNSLEHARKQLPKTRPGVIFLRIGGNRTHDELQTKAKIVNGAVRRLFSQTRRVVGVILLTRKYEFFEDERMHIVHSLWRTMPNENTEFQVSLLGDFPNEHFDCRAEAWVRLDQYRPRFVFG